MAPGDKGLAKARMGRPGVGHILCHNDLTKIPHGGWIVQWGFGDAGSEALYNIKVKGHAALGLKVIEIHEHLPGGFSEGEG